VVKVFRRGLEIGLGEEGLVGGDVGCKPEGDAELRVDVAGEVMAKRGEVRGGGGSGDCGG